MRVAAEQVPVAAHVLRERDSSGRRAGRRTDRVQPTSDAADRHAQGRLRRLRSVPRPPRGRGRRRRRPAAVSEPGGRGRPPERHRRWRAQAAGCWRTVSASSGRRRRASPRWRSGRLTATTSAVSCSSPPPSVLLSVSFFVRPCVSLRLSLSVCGAVRDERRPQLSRQTCSLKLTR